MRRLILLFLACFLCGSAPGAYPMLYPDAQDFLTAAGASGPVLLQDGTSTVPGLGFILDPNTGLYRVGSDTLGFTTGGGLRMKIDNNGIYGVPFYSDADGSNSAARFSWTLDTDLGLFRVGANTLGVAASSGVNFNGRLYNSAAALALGGACAPARGGVTGSICVGEDAGNISMEVKGKSHFENDITLHNALALYYGTGLDYWMRYSSADTRFELRSTDVDGIGTNGLVLTIDDGTDDVLFYGDIQVAGIYYPAPTSDVTPSNVNIHSAHSYSQGTQTESNLILGGGSGESWILVNDYANGGSDTYSIEINNNGSATTRTEGVDWTAATDDATTACSIYDDLIANPITGVTAGRTDGTCSDAKVFIIPDDDTTHVTDLTATDAGGGGVFGVVTDGNNGAVLFASRRSNNLNPAIAFLGDPDTGFYHQASGSMGFTSNGSRDLLAANNVWTWYVTSLFNNGNLNFGTTGSGNLTIVTASNGEISIEPNGTGETSFKDHLVNIGDGVYAPNRTPTALYVDSGTISEFDGTVWFDGQVYFDSNTNFSTNTSLSIGDLGGSSNFVIKAGAGLGEVQMQSDSGFKSIWYWCDEDNCGNHSDTTHTHTTHKLTSNNATYIDEYLEWQYTGFKMGEARSDKVPEQMWLQAGSAWNQATGANQTGADMNVCSGIGTRQFACTQAIATGDTATLVVNGTTYNLVEGVDFNCLTDDETCCDALGVEIESQIPAIDADCDTLAGTCYLEDLKTDAIFTCSVDLSATDGGVDGVAFVETEGADGVINLKNALTASGILDNQSGRIINITTVNDVNYTALTGDHLIAYIALTVARTVTLPDALCAEGRTFDVKDEAGNAAAANIVIDPEGGTTIDGVASVSITGDYNSLTVYCRNSVWFTR